MMEYYPYIKNVHIFCVLLSGLLFVFRGFAVFLNASWPMSKYVRRSSSILDSLLLAAAFCLWWILPSSTFSSGWLGVKLFLVGLYIVLGSFALKYAKTMRMKKVFFVFSVFVFINIFFVAYTHNPKGVFSIVG